MPNLIESIKIAALEAVEATKPCAIIYGKVIGTNPLQIQIDQKLILGSKQLILTKNVMNYETEITLINEDNSKAKRKAVIHSGLKNGESAILLRAQGGQKFIVLDRVGVM